MRLKALVFAAMLFTAVPALAQEAPQPGTACSAGEIHRTQHIGGPENPGTGYSLVCNGTNWKLVTEWNTATAQSLFQVDNDTGACNSDKLGRMRYDDALDTWQYCDGTNWVDLIPASGGNTPLPFSFTDLSDQSAETLVSSEIVPISGISASVQVTITGSGTPEFRICNNFDCSTVDHTWGTTAQNIDNGQFLQMRLTTASTKNTTRNAVVTVGTAVASWRVTVADRRLVFVTSTTYTGGAIDGVSGADDLCQTRADAAGLTGSFKAWISDGTTANNPSSRFTQAGGPYELTTGTVVANNWADLTDGTLDSAINYNENGVSASGNNVWTNTGTGGAYVTTTNDCTNWTSTSGTNGGGGTSSGTGSSWTNQTTYACTSSNRLYCFAQNSGGSGATTDADNEGSFTKCQVKNAASATYPTCPSGYTRIHTYAMGRTYSGLSSANGLMPDNTTDGSWFYTSGTESTVACAVCEKD